MENYEKYTKSDMNADWKEREFKKGQDRFATARTLHDGSKELEIRKGLTKSYKDSSPEEVKQAVKRTVSKGVAAAAGAVEGFAEEMENDHIPETAEKAIAIAGETTRKIAKTTVEQAKKTKEAVLGGDSGKVDVDKIGSMDTSLDDLEGEKPY